LSTTGEAENLLALEDNVVSFISYLQITFPFEINIKMCKFPSNIFFEILILVKYKMFVWIQYNLRGGREDAGAPLLLLENKMTIG